MPAKSKELSLRLKGNGISKKSFPLRPFATAISNTVALFEEALVSVVGDQGGVRGVKKTINARGGLQKDGSIIQSMVLHVESEHLLLAPTKIEESIWDASIDSYEYVMGIARVKSKGQVPDVSVDEKTGLISVLISDKKLKIPMAIYLAEAKFRKRFIKLSGLVGNEIEEVTIFDSKKIIRFSLEEKRLLNPEMQNDKELYVSGNVISFNKETSHGRFQVSEGEAVEAGTYGFSVAGNQALAPYIFAMIRKSARMRVVPQYEVYFTGSRVLARLWALGIESARGDEEPTLL